MKKNVGNIDRIIRIVLGLIIGVVGIMNHSWLGLIGIVPIATAFLSYCPAYSLFRFSTNIKKQL
ncbi:MAG: DUF2892 domain-containing protein [Bacteroidetes bacterium]|jgi:hypothetical protein|nr:DUF2892 domain-containing protein [Bacteroidota bacterium]